MAWPILGTIAVRLASCVAFLDSIFRILNKFKTIIIGAIILGFMYYFESRFFEILSTVQGEIMPQFETGGGGSGGGSGGRFSVMFLIELIILYPAHISRDLWDTSAVVFANTFVPVRYSLLLVSQLWLAAFAIFSSAIVPIISYKFIYRAWKYFESRMMILLQARAEQSK